MDEQVSKNAHVLPRHVSKSLGRPRIYMAGGFTDDRQIWHDGVNGHPVGGKGFERMPARG